MSQKHNNERGKCAYTDKMVEKKLSIYRNSVILRHAYKEHRTLPKLFKGQKEVFIFPEVTFVSSQLILNSFMLKDGLPVERADPKKANLEVECFC